MSNQTGRQIVIKVGTDEQNWSQSLVSFESTMDSLSEIGIVAHKATLRLNQVLTSPESLDPLVNSRWRLGQTIKFYDPTDTFQIGYYKIVKRPIYNRLGYLDITLGCWLTWASTLELDEDRSGVDIGIDTNSKDVVVTLLESLGIPGANINLPTNWDYNLEYPLIKDGKSSFIQFAGKLTYANNCRYLYQNAEGIISVGQWDKSNITPYDSITISENESVFEHSPDAIEPVERLTVAGTGYQLIDLAQPYGVSAFITEPAKNYNPDAFGTVVLRTTLTTETDLENRIIERRVVNTQPRAATWVSSDSVTSTNITQVNTEEYDLVNGQLLEVKDFEFGNVRILVPPEDPAFGEVVIRRKIVTYEYLEVDGDFIVTKKTELETAPQMTIDGRGAPGTPNRFSQVTTRLTVTEWLEERPNFWVRSVRKYAVAGQNPDKRGGNIDPLALLSLKPEVYPDSPPPATQYWKDGIDLKQTEYTATVNWEQPQGPSGLIRPRTIIIEPAFSNAQCFEIANRTLEIYEGRQDAHIIQWELEPGQQFYWVPPLTNLEVNRGATTYLFKLDAISWYYSPTESYIGAIGILINESTGIEPGQTPPSEPPPFSLPGDICLIANPANSALLLGPTGEQIGCYSEFI